MSAHVHLCFLWHHHQPCYRDLLTGQLILPWVRLHGIKDYYGMAALLEEVPAAHATINLVPSLIEQLESYVSGEGEDRALILSRRNAASLEPDERQFLLRFFFMAHPDNMIRPLPRYAELWERAEYGKAPPEKAARRFSDQDFRDLQVLANLVWFHPLVLEREPELMELRRKGREFTEGDKSFVLAKQMEILGRVLPLHKALADRGQLEISMSPFYHPILPLLCNMESSRESMPHVRLPSVQRVFRVDAERQIREGLLLHERVFGRRPRGMWPSEGSVSDDVVAVAGGAGLRWMATDEAILTRSLDRSIPRDSRGIPSQPDVLYRPYRREVNGTSALVVFRDAVLSNLISFDYQRYAPADAVNDFTRRVEGIRDSLPNGDWLIGVVLDGENPWEHYPGNGVAFLRELYGRLTRVPGVSLSTMADACERVSQPGHLHHVYAGSWINHNFHVWLGHDEDRRAWEALNRVREFVRAASRANGWTEDAARQLGLAGGYDAGTPDSVRKDLDLAWRCVFAAEGSDWFWWYGDDFSSALDGDFDALFRRHLMNAYHALKQMPPADLSRPIKLKISHPVFREPNDLLEVVVDGRSTGYFEWDAAGHYDPQGDMSAMGRSGHKSVKEVFYGFDLQRFLLRVDPAPDGRAEDLLRGDGLRVVFIHPRRRVVRVQGSNGGLRAQIVDPEGVGEVKPAEAAAGAVVEVACTFADLGFQKGDHVEFFVEVPAPSGPRIRFPAGTALRFTVPADDYAKVNWHV
jgi:alpha-amylase/alpha-mannosidase (GH57 family)